MSPAPNPTPSLEPEDLAYFRVLLESHRAQAGEGVAAALQRLREGVYGRCLMCGEPIDRARLELEPSALRCLHCQALFESRQHPGAPRRRGPESTSP